MTLSELVYQLFWHNSSVLEVTYYAQNNASIMWKSLSTVQHNDYIFPEKQCTTLFISNILRFENITLAKLNHYQWLLHKSVQPQAAFDGLHGKVTKYNHVFPI